MDELLETEANAKLRAENSAEIILEEFLAGRMCANLTLTSHVAPVILPLNVTNAITVTLVLGCSPKQVRPTLSQALALTYLR